MDVGKKILFVDDDPHIIQLYSAVFGASSINFTIARNGLEALEKAESERPSLILLDIMLPDLNGLDVLKKLKQNPQTANIPVWMISNLAEQVNKETADSLGATEYIVKASFTPKQVTTKILAFLGQSDPSAATPQKV